MKSFQPGNVPPVGPAIADGVVEGLDGLPEVDPERMRVVPEQGLPEWDVRRIREWRAEYYDSTRLMFADAVLGVDDLDSP